MILDGGGANLFAETYRLRNRSITMDNKKESPLYVLLTNIATLFILVLILAVVFLPFATVGFFLEGYPTVGWILLGILVALILFFVLFIKHGRKKRAAKEAEYRAKNIAEYESDGGRLGVLLLEYDSCKNTTALKNGFPAIFSEDETPCLVAYGERLEGRQVERIADRLLADREQIFEGIVRKLRSGGDAEPSGIKLDEISIEDGGTTVVGYFTLQGIPNNDIYTEVSYTVNKDGYKIELDYD